MANRTSVDKLEKHIKDKRNELMWALSMQDYSYAQVARIFNLHRSTVLRIIASRPDGWKTKWVKSGE